MKRQALSNGRWFNVEAADLYSEDSEWDGSNHISCATGSQWNHEELYRTKSKKWVLHSWSQWQGSTDSWEQVGDDDAARWLVRNGHQHPDVEAEIAALEI